MGGDDLLADPPSEVEPKQGPSLRDEIYDLSDAPGPLSNVVVPEPRDLDRYIKNRRAAEELGKALFWDMQVGSDGRTACASCHWNAGADIRVRNTLSPHGSGMTTMHGFANTNLLLNSSFFPTRRLENKFDSTSKVLHDTPEVVGSQGVISKEFHGIIPGRAVDSGKHVADPVFSFQRANARQVTGRNALSVINAVFYDRQFWDGRASRYFNGVNPFGDADPDAKVWTYSGGSLRQTHLKIDNSSLASQAVGPPNNSVEMSWGGRDFSLLGRKMLSIRPLALQRVDSTDSLLGKYANPKGRGLGIDFTYAKFIRDAFQPQWWESPQPVDGGFTQMEANFSLFFGLAIQMYESTLVSDQSRYDQFARGDQKALSNREKQGLEIFLHQGKCSTCHTGPEFAGGTVSGIRRIGGSKTQLIERMVMGDKQPAFYDSGFYNIGVRPTEEDLGIGANGLFGPLSYSAQRQLGRDVGFRRNIGAKARLAVRGAFKTPTLRNIELTGPYFHNGGQQTLQQVVEFYVRGGDFPRVNIQDLDADIEVIPELVNRPDLIETVVEFLRTLTDPRVEFQKPPFDHPELIIPHGHRFVIAGIAIDDYLVLPATGAAGGERLRRFDDLLQGQALGRRVSFESQQSLLMRMRFARSSIDAK